MGIGNYGSRYSLTRHNAGFIILDMFAEKHGIRFRESKFDYHEAEGSIGTFHFLLVKPVTYVNRSGIAAIDALNNHGLLPEDMLVVVDDINLEPGRIRFRKSGGDGGHNGLFSIISALATEMFPRLRFGIGSEFEHGDMPDYVLSKFSAKEMSNLRSSFEFCVLLLEQFISGGSKMLLEFYSKEINKILPESK